MSDALLLLHLVGGYFFLKHFEPTHIYFNRLENYHLIFTSAFPAFFLAGISFGILNFLGIENVSFNLIAGGGISMMLGLLLPWFFNLSITDERRLKRTSKIINAKSDPLELLLLSSLIEEKSICITLKNHKVYIGLVTQLLNPSTPLQYIQILPILSGYRDQKTKKMHLPLNYQDVYSKILEGNSEISIGDFQMVISVSEIISANVFDSSVYEEHFQD